MENPSSPRIRSTLVMALTGVAAGFGLGLALSAYGAAGDSSSADSAPSAHSDSVGAAIGDSAITTKVRAGFLDDDRIRNSHIKVKTTNGVVTLTGSAANSDAKAAAEEVASNVHGVKSVDNELVTGSSNGSVHRAVAKSEKVGSDSWITTKVKSEIMADSISKGFKVGVKTVNGVVMLHGTLPNDDAVSHVKDLAEKVDGVKSVNTTQLKSAAG
ncbi:MAG TPA: BON domain-containing protein [Steroidobacteraceae bacterium]